MSAHLDQRVTMNSTPTMSPLGLPIPWAASNVISSPGITAIDCNALGPPEPVAKSNGVARLYRVSAVDGARRQRGAIQLDRPIDAPADVPPQPYRAGHADEACDRARPGKDRREPADSAIRVIGIGGMSPHSIWYACGSGTQRNGVDWR